MGGVNSVKIIVIPDKITDILYPHDAPMYVRVAAVSGHDALAFTHQLTVCSSVNENLILKY